jgi:hypothetical protein
MLLAIYLEGFEDFSVIFLPEMFQAKSDGLALAILKRDREKGIFSEAGLKVWPRPTGLIFWSCVHTGTKVLFYIISSVQF